jgi:hypothetical protein
MEVKTMARLARKAQDDRKPAFRPLTRKRVPESRALAADSLPWLARRDPARSAGAAALGAVALGALAFGALAIGALAVGRLTVRNARVKNLEVDELTVRSLRIHKTSSADVTSVAEREPSRESTVGI